ncbi:MAG: 8-amino-7-oxononanoate synthase [Verrucomicrobia bacterium]|nr:8-amino-7-oxononanoate synthase [Verrucomicrobiota bacterium]
MQEELGRIKNVGLLRRLRILESPQTTHVEIDGRSLVNFSSNDYLGLANHPALKEAAMAEWDRAGFGSGASRLVCGTLAAHERLEEAISGFKRAEAALCFSSGYAAAMGTIPALCATDAVIILDKLCHACLVDASRLSGAHLRVFPHNDMEKLESHLRWARSKHPASRVLVVAESVYSMDGDIAPLREIVELKDRHGAWLFLDEAHGVGVLGAGGRGLAEESGVEGRVEIQMGTLGKALGAHGAYIAGSRCLREFLINRARSFIYSTAPPAPVAAAAAKAVELLAGPEGALLLQSLWKNIENLSAALGIPRPPSAIVPIIIGDESAAMQAGENLLASGFLAPAIRYPTVARGTARLRLTLSSAHSEQDITGLANVLRSPVAPSGVSSPSRA